MAMKKIAVFAGSFDPFTVGHLDLVTRGSKLFDELWVLMAVNNAKKYMFTKDARLRFIQRACKDFSNVKVASFDGLTVNFMNSINANYLIRGVRNSSDMDYELSVAWNNSLLKEDCETLFFPSAPEHLQISSSVVRELLNCGLAGSEGKNKLGFYVPSCILDDLILEYQKSR